MKEQSELMIKHFQDLSRNMEKFSGGNKAAGTRARKNLSVIASCCKELRKEIQNVKNKI